MLAARAVGRDDRDAAVHERRDADVALGVDRQRVEQLHAGQPDQEVPPFGENGFGRTTPGPASSHQNTRPVWVSATYTRLPSGERPTPFGASSGYTTSRMLEPSGSA